MNKRIRNKKLKEALKKRREKTLRIAELVRDNLIKNLNERYGVGNWPGSEEA